jgi:hypothetical protein
MRQKKVFNFPQARTLVLVSKSDMATHKLGRFIVQFLSLFFFNHVTDKINLPQQEQSSSRFQQFFIRKIIKDRHNSHLSHPSDHC